MYAAAHVPAAEVVDSPEPSAGPFLPPLLSIRIAAATASATVTVSLERRGRPRAVAGVEQLEVRQDVEGSEQLPNAHAAVLDGLRAHRVVQNLFGRFVVRDPQESRKGWRGGRSDGRRHEGVVNSRPKSGRGFMTPGEAGLRGTLGRKSFAGWEETYGTLGHNNHARLPFLGE